MILLLGRAGAPCEICRQRGGGREGSEWDGGRKDDLEGGRRDEKRGLCFGGTMAK